jgi:FkbM family methyltransferase
VGHEKCYRQSLRVKSPLSITRNEAPQRPNLGDFLYPPSRDTEVRLRQERNPNYFLESSPNERIARRIVSISLQQRITMKRKSHQTARSLVFGLARIAEKIAAYIQGKGYGTASIRKENQLVHDLLRRPPKLAIDIGGNVGEYTAELRRRTAEVEIHTFEPADTNIKKLNQRFQGDKRIKVLPLAVSDKAGTATLFSDTAGSGLGSLTQRNLEHFNIDFNVRESIQTIRFEDYWKSTLNCSQLDIVKIDIEGHELSALKGFGEAIHATKVIQFEFGGCNIDTRTYFQDFWKFFIENDFTLYRITPLGIELLKGYRESDEYFSTTNYIAVNNRSAGID